MHPINILTSHAVPLDRPNVDTDQIIPKQFLKRIERTGYGDFLFYDWRRIHEGPDAGQPDQTFVLTSTITRARRSSSPEKTSAAAAPAKHAAWALTDFGFLAVIAPSFADIFYSNAGKNGMVLVRLPQSDVQTLMSARQKIQRIRSPSTWKPKPSRTTRASAPNSKSTRSANTAVKPVSTTSASRSATNPNSTPSNQNTTRILAETARHRLAVAF